MRRRVRFVCVGLLVASAACARDGAALRDEVREDVARYEAPPEFDLVDEREEGLEQCGAPSGCETISTRLRYSVDASVTPEEACAVVRRSVETSFDRTLDDIGPDEADVCRYQTSEVPEGEPFISVSVAVDDPSTPSVGGVEGKMGLRVSVGRAV